MNRIVKIKGGRILDPSQGIDGFGDVWMQGGVIINAPQDETSMYVETIDASGFWVCPGLIDAHVHLREPGQEAKEDIASGLRAAARGGFTAVMPMPNTSPANDSPALTRMMIEKAEALGGTRVYPVAAATVGRKGETVADLAALKAAGAKAFSDDGSAVVDDAVMAEVLRRCKELDMPFSQHAEDPAIVKGGVLHDGPTAKRLGVPGWPSEGESRIVERDIALAESLGASVHVGHVSTSASVAAIRAAKARGVRVTGEAAPHHLLLTDKIAESAGTLAKVNPPLRPESDVDACVKGLRDGTLDIAATDHAPHTDRDKSGGFVNAAFGMVGLETAVPLLLILVERGDLSPMRLIEAMSTLPARIFHLPGGTLAPGAPADITLINSTSPHTVEPATFVSKSRNTPFAGFKVPGRAVMTIVGGKVVYRD